MLTPSVFLDGDYTVPSTSLFQDFPSQMEADINLFACFLISYVHLSYIITRIGNRAKCSFSEDSTQIIIHVFSFLLAEESHFLSHSLYIILIWLQTLLLSVLISFGRFNLSFDCSQFFAYKFWLPRSICSCWLVCFSCCHSFSLLLNTNRKKNNVSRNFFFHNFYGKSYPNYLSGFYYLCNICKHLQIHK